MRLLGLSHQQRRVGVRVALAAGDSSVVVPASSRFPPDLPGYLTAWEQLPHKNIFDSLFLNSFYVVNGIIFTIFFCLIFLFFRIHNFKKPYNMTSLNRKKKKKEKALIEKEDPQNTAVLTLLQKIDILRLTKRRHKNELLESLLTANCLSLLQHKIESTPTSCSQLQFSVC